VGSPDREKAGKNVGKKKRKLNSKKGKEGKRVVQRGLGCWVRGEGVTPGMSNSEKPFGGDWENELREKKKRRKKMQVRPVITSPR